MQIKTKIVSCHTADSKPVKQEVDGTVILAPLVFPAPVVNPLQPNLIIASESGAYPSEALLRCSPLGLIS